MPDWNALADGFAYDLWANRLWLDCLIRKELRDPDLSIFSHILSAQSVWLARFQGSSPNTMPVIEPTEASLSDLHDRWIAALQGATDDVVIDYKRTTGEPFRRTFSDIARHVVDHGTYHRGELRGLCLARGDEDFPETGFIGFSFAREPDAG